MIVGSHASSRHGEVCSTRDIDIVIDAEEAQLRGLAEAFREGSCVSLQADLDALKHRSMFEAIDLGTGWKCDLILFKDRPHEKGAFSRREQACVLGIEAFVQSPEDTIPSKLEWSKPSGSELQMRGVVGILRVQGSQLDRRYLDHWAEVLRVDYLQDQARREAIWNANHH